MDYSNKPASYYKNVRKDMAVYMPKGVSVMLEVGCGNGRFGEMIKESHSCEVWGIELMPEEGAVAKGVLDNVLIGPCEEMISSLPDNHFDVIYFNDVLEHLSYPDEVLKAIGPKLKSGGKLISSIPNIRYHKALIPLLFNGDFKYTPDGVMDKTHLRFFTQKSVQRMFEECGYQVERQELINKTKSIKPYLYNVMLGFTGSDLFYMQIATVAKKV